MRKPKTKGQEGSLSSRKVSITVNSRPACIDLEASPAPPARVLPRRLGPTERSSFQKKNIANWSVFKGELQ